MYSSMENNPLDNLPPETRQRVENALKALGGGTAQDVFANRYQGNASQETEQPVEGAPMIVGSWTYQEANPLANTPGLQQTAGSNQAWAHWDYTPEEWELFDRLDWEPFKNRYRLTAIIGSIICIVVISALVVFAWNQFSSLFNEHAFIVVFTPGVLLLTAFLVVILLAAASAKEAKKRHLARANPAEPHRVTLSEQGVWESGICFKIDSLLLELASVKITSNPTVLTFHLIKSSLGTNGNSVTFQKFKVLVPRKYEAEAEAIRQRYYNEVIKRPAYNPKEPA
jgi:hypothetical protein